MTSGAQDSQNTATGIPLSSDSTNTPMRTSNCSPHPQQTSVNSGSARLLMAALHPVALDGFEHYRYLGL